MGIISWIVFGLLAGILAKFVMPGDDGGGFIRTTWPRCRRRIGRRLHRHATRFWRRDGLQRPELRHRDCRLGVGCLWIYRRVKKRLGACPSRVGPVLGRRIARPLDDHPEQQYEQKRRPRRRAARCLPRGTLGAS